MCVAAAPGLLVAVAVALHDIDEDGQGCKSVAVVVDAGRGAGTV